MSTIHRERRGSRMFPTSFVSAKKVAKEAAAKLPSRQRPNKLHDAAMEGDINDLNDLLSKPATRALIDSKTPQGWTPAFYAARYGHLDCLMALLKAGADKECANDNGSTALMVAAMFGHLHCVRALVEAGCDPKKKNTPGSTALSFAIGENHMGCARYLEQAINKKPKQLEPLKLQNVADETIEEGPE